MLKAFKDFVSLIYPRVCINCGNTLISSEEYLCLHCLMDLPKGAFASDDNEVLRSKLLTVSNLGHVFTHLKFQRDGVAQKILHEIKYHGEQALAILIGSLFAKEFAKNLKNSNVDILIPVPLHKAKLKRRGFNQSELIAQGISDYTGIPLENDILRRNVDTSTQTKKKKVSRWSNVENVFGLRTNIDLSEQHVLLIDDVITTGATIESAANSLNMAGCSKISVGCIASGNK